MLLLRGWPTPQWGIEHIPGDRRMNFLTVLLYQMTSYIFQHFYAKSEGFCQKNFADGRAVGLKFAAADGRIG